MRPRSCFRHMLLCAALLSLAITGRAENETAPAYAPTSDYEPQTIEGWPVLVRKQFLQDEPELCEQILSLLRHQLQQIPCVVPAPAVEKLRKVTIWVERNDPHHPCMAYHPSPQWLKLNGMNPDKVGCVELANADAFLSWTRAQPYMVLHELAHGYHHQFLEGGYDNKELAAAFERAGEKELYREVLHINGRRVKGYAATNPMEYFAESTEAFFGTNDFFPFVRAELKEHDPEMFELLRRLWGEEKPQ